VRCGDAQLCVYGECVCRDGLTLVDGACVDLQSDPDNCGAAGNACDRFQNCSQGTCRWTCQRGEWECSDQCVVLRSDPRHCGRCGRACDGDEVCVDGECRVFNGPPTCLMCPCDSECDGDTCCDLPGTSIPICVDADGCP
jgi:hypothetical protein